LPMISLVNSKLLMVSMFQTYYVGVQFLDDVLVLDMLDSLLKRIIDSDAHT
jgi:hypothetical protein